MNVRQDAAIPGDVEPSKGALPDVAGPETDPPALEGLRILYRGSAAGDGAAGFDVYETTLATGARRRLGPERSMVTEQQLGASPPVYDASGARALVVARHRGETREALVVAPCRSEACAEAGVQPLLPEARPASWVGWGPGEEAALVAAGNELWLVGLDGTDPQPPRLLSDELYVEEGADAAWLTAGGRAVAYRAAASATTTANAVELLQLASDSANAVRLRLTTGAGPTDPSVSALQVAEGRNYVAYALPWGDGSPHDDQRIYALDVAAALDGTTSQPRELPRPEGTGYALVRADADRLWLEVWTSPYAEDRRLLGMSWDGDEFTDVRAVLAPLATADQGPPALCGDHVATLWPREEPTAVLLYRLSTGATRRVDLGTSVSANRPRFSNDCEALVVDDTPRAWIVVAETGATLSMPRLSGVRAFWRPGAGSDYVFGIGSEALVYADDGTGAVARRSTQQLAHAVVRGREILFVAHPGDGSVELRRFALDGPDRDSTTLLSIPGGSASGEPADGVLQGLAVDNRGRVTFTVPFSGDAELAGQYELRDGIPERLLGPVSIPAPGAGWIAAPAGDRALISGDYDGDGLRELFGQDLAAYSAPLRLSEADVDVDEAQVSAGGWAHFRGTSSPEGAGSVTALQVAPGAALFATRYRREIDRPVAALRNASDGWLPIVEADPTGRSISEGLISPDGRYFAGLVPFQGGRWDLPGPLKPVLLGTPARLHLLDLDALAADALEAAHRVSDAEPGRFTLLSEADGGWLLYEVAAGDGGSQLRSRWLATGDDQLVTDEDDRPWLARLQGGQMGSAGEHALLVHEHCAFTIVDRATAKARLVRDFSTSCVTAGAVDSFAMGNHNGIDLVDLSRPEEIATVRILYPESMVFSPDGRYLAVSRAGLTPSLRIVDTRDPTLTPMVLDTARPNGLPIVFSPDGRWLAAPYEDGFENGHGVWSSTHPERLAEVAPPGVRIVDLVFVP